jgi:hypothetical protein
MLSALRLPVNKKAIEVGIGSLARPPFPQRTRKRMGHPQLCGAKMILKQYAVSATPLTMLGTRVVFHCRFAASCKACALIDARGKNLPPTTTA